MLFNRIAFLSLLIAVSAQANHSQEDQAPCSAPWTAEQHTGKKQIVMTIEGWVMLSLYMFDKDAGVPEEVNTKIQESSFQAAYFLYKGKFNTFPIQSALDAYYFSAEPFSNYKEEFFASSAGQKLEKRVLENYKDLKHMVNPHYKALAQKAFLEGFKARFRAYIEFLHDFLPERYQKTSSHHICATSEDIERMIKNPETQDQKYILACSGIKEEGSYWQHANKFLSQEFPETHILFHTLAR